MVAACRCSTPATGVCGAVSRHTASMVLLDNNALTADCRQLSQLLFIAAAAASQYKHLTCCVSCSLLSRSACQAGLPQLKATSAGSCGSDLEALNHSCQRPPPWDSLLWHAVDPGSAGTLPKRLLVKEEHLKSTRADQACATVLCQYAGRHAIDPGCASLLPERLLVTKEDLQMRSTQGNVMSWTLCRQQAMQQFNSSMYIVLRILMCPLQQLDECMKAQYTHLGRAQS